MPLTGEVLGGDLYFRLSSDGGSTFDIIGVARGAELSFSFPSIDVSSQGSGGYVKRKAGKRKSCSISVNSLVQFVDAAGELMSDDIFTLADNGTETSWKFEPSTPGAGDITYAGSGVIEDISISAGSDDAEATSSFTINSTGSFSKTVNT